jgi:NitT/TauT family transport system substrate-binding protein
MMRAVLSRRAIAAMVFLAASVGSAHAADLVKVAAGQRGNWDTSVTELGERAGIFAKNGLEIELLYTQGGGETQQAVISGSVDVGVAAGIMGVMGAFSKGAPVRIIGSETNGAADFWYATTASDIKSLRDTDGKTIAYSTNGSSTHGIVLAFMKEYGLKAKPTATGGPAATFTQVMSGQVDVGWSAPPFGFNAEKDGKIRIVARGNDLPGVREQTSRVLITTAATLASRGDVIQRFIAAYRQTIDWMYNDPQALKTYAELIQMPEETARRVRDEFFPRFMLDLDAIVGIDQLVQDAVTYKYTAQMLTKTQLAELIQIPPR